ncbi:MAG: MarR family transcriptional regulator [Alphaproteobacteria bacterium]|nr:MAG: MarR family transcriptional regulator [Alphaproteobacteria bacterium]
MKADVDNDNSVVRQPIGAAEIPQIANIELLFFAYRAFTADPDRILARFNFGRAHHRALYFVSRRPGMTVAELIAILGITKQSLSRVLRQLIASGHIRQMAGPADRRQRRLYPTRAGRALILELSRPQSRRIDEALRAGGFGDDRAIAGFMRAMLDPQERELLRGLSGQAE